MCANGFIILASLCGLVSVPSRRYLFYWEIEGAYYYHGTTRALHLGFRIVYMAVGPREQGAGSRITGHGSIAAGVFVFHHPSFVLSTPSSMIPLGRSYGNFERVEGGGVVPRDEKIK